MDENDKKIALTALGLTAAALVIQNRKIKKLNKNFYTFVGLVDDYMRAKAQEEFDAKFIEIIRNNPMK